jgi:hypothetical protein
MGDDAEEAGPVGREDYRVSLPGSFSSKTRTAKTIVASPRGPNQPMKSLSASARIGSWPRAHPLQRYQGLVWVDSSGSIVAPRAAGFGATAPLRRIPAIVSFLSPQRALNLIGGNRSSCPQADIRRTQGSIGGGG